MADYYYDRGNWDGSRRSGSGQSAGDYNPGYHRTHATVAAADHYHDRGCRPDFRQASPYGAERRTELVSGDGRAYVAPPSTTRQEQAYAPRERRHTSGGGGSSAWCFGDPEMQRRRRVASYKAYSAEGKLKASVRKGFRWIKGKCAGLVQGF